jgi:hypothetical protein
MSLPVVSANASNPTRDVDTSAGYAGAAGLIGMQLAATLTKRLDQSFSAGSNAGACDVGSKGPNQTWTIFLIGAALSVGPASSLANVVSSLVQTSGVATLTIAGHPLGAGDTLVIGSTNGGINGFSGARAISSVTSNTIVFSNSGSDFAAANLPNAAWGFPTISGFDVLASQAADPVMPPGFTLLRPLATITTDGIGNIATVEPIQ